jgi:hypothetical protein
VLRNLGVPVLWRVVLPVVPTLEPSLEPLILARAQNRFCVDISEYEANRYCRGSEP